MRRIKPALPLPWRLAALPHDAPEYVSMIGDLITPFKAAVGLNYRQFEKRLRSADRSAGRSASRWLSASAMPALVSTHVMAFAASIAGQGRAPLRPRGETITFVAPSGFSRMTDIATSRLFSPMF